MQQTTLQIDGMSCGHCVGAVQKAIAAVGGATAKTVSIGAATVEYDESRVKPAQIAAAVTGAGYPATAT